MPKDRYTDTGLRGDDPREGFGDDMGTRVGRPDGARARDDGNPSTNDEPVADGLEGSINVEGDAQRRVRDAAADRDQQHRVDDL